MNSVEKQEIVAELAKKFAASKASFVADFQGCTCQDLTDLRRKLRASGASMAVVKNTLAKRAVVGTSAEKLAVQFRGPMAVIWADEDPVGPAKIISGFAKAKENFKLKAGVFEGEVIDRNGVENLASLPSKEELYSNLLALINAPATKLLQTINAPGTQLARVLEAWRKKLEEKN